MEVILLRCDTFGKKNCSMVRISKKFLGYRVLVRHLLIGWQVNTDASFKLLIFCTYRGDTSNFRYMATKVPFEAGDYLIFRPKVDRWVGSIQRDYGGLIKQFFFLNRKKILASSYFVNQSGLVWRTLSKNIKKSIFSSKVIIPSP